MLIKPSQNNRLNEYSQNSLNSGLQIRKLKRQQSSESQYFLENSNLEPNQGKKMINGNQRSQTMSNHSQAEKSGRINILCPKYKEINEDCQQFVSLQYQLNMINAPERIHSSKRSNHQLSFKTRQSFHDQIMMKTEYENKLFVRNDQRLVDGKEDIAPLCVSCFETEEDEEEQKIQKSELIMEHINRLSSLGSDSQSEEEIKEETDRTFSPIRSDLPSNDFNLMNFRNQFGNQKNDQTNSSRQIISYRLSQELNILQNSRINNQISREYGSSLNDSVNNLETENQYLSTEERIFNDLFPSQFVSNRNNRDERRILEGLRSLVDIINNRLANFQGSLNNANLEELSSMLCVVSLLQGISGITKKLQIDQINEFPLVKIKQIEENEVCSICLEQWKINDTAKLLGCMHRFHPSCIDDWLKQKSICPNCKQDQLQFFSDNIPENLQE